MTNLTEMDGYLGLDVSQKRLKVVKIPTTERGICFFYGLSNVFRGFLPSFSKLHRFQSEATKRPANILQRIYQTRNKVRESAEGSTN